MITVTVTAKHAGLTALTTGVRACFVGCVVITAVQQGCFDGVSKASQRKIKAKLNKLKMTLVKCEKHAGLTTKCLFKSKLLLELKFIFDKHLIVWHF